MSIILSPKHGGILTQQELVNFSTAKQKFSFSRSPRFPSVQKKIISHKIQYELPSQFDENPLSARRTPSFGIGDRFIQLKKNLVPSPDSYRLPSDFDPNLNAPSVITKKLAYTFGASREVYQRVFSPIQKHNGDPLQPGPGTYEPLKTMGKEGRKYTIKGRIAATNDIVRIKVKQNIPGPGTYQPRTSMHHLGVYYVSNIENSKTTRISPTGQRFQDPPEANRSPRNLGPGAYDQKYYADTHNDRVYFLSQHKNPMTRRFGTSQRQRISNATAILVPGPGHYRPPSDFGYLDLIRSPRTQQSPRAQTVMLGEKQIQLPPNQAALIRIHEFDPRSKSRQFAGFSTATSPKRPKKFITERDINSFMRAESVGGTSTNIYSNNGGAISPANIQSNQNASVHPEGEVHSHQERRASGTTIDL